jgi:hypothetical protein
MQVTRGIVLFTIAAVFSVTLGAGQRQAAQPPLVDNRAAATQKGEIGIPECDRYFALVDACVTSGKMSSEDKKAAQFSVDRLKAMQPLARAPQGKATLGDRCAKTLDLAQKDDKYGCSKADAKTARR